MNATLRVLRQVSRSLRRSPSLVAAVVLSLALCLGANSLMMSAVSAVLMRPFPFEKPERIVAIHEHQPRGETRSTGLSYPNYLDLAAQAEAFAEIAAYKELGLSVAGGEEPEYLSGLAVSARLFPLLGVAPRLGRGFELDDDRPGAPPTVLLSDELWRRSFGGRVEVVGQSMRVDVVPHRILGVMPPGFRFPNDSEAWVALAPRVASDPRNFRDLTALGRLRPGQSLASARSTVETVGNRLAASFPDTNAGWSFRVSTLRDELTGETLQGLLVLLLAGVFVVLLIACANISSLLLARAAKRRHEVAIRIALGASRARVVLESLAETLILALFGGFVGIGFALMGLGIARRTLAGSGDFPAWVEWRLDGTALLYTFALVLVAAILVGLVPALHGTRGDLTSTLKDGGRAGSAGHGQGRTRAGLVLAELALCCTLLVATALLVRSVGRLAADTGGVQPDRLTTLRVFLASQRFDSPVALTRAVNEITSRIARLPGVQVVGASNTIPLSGGGSRRPIRVAGREVKLGEEPVVFYTGVDGPYFRAIGAPLIRGREFTETEVADGSRVAIVNRSFAERFWPGESALGQRVQLKTDTEWTTVVGVVADFKNGRIDRRTPPSLYVPLPYQTASFMGVLVRADLPSSELVPRLRAAIREAQPSVPIFNLAPMEEVRRAGFWQNRLAGAIFTVFGVLSLLLAFLGIFGLFSYSVTERRRELGIRLALGASTDRLVRDLVVRGLRLTSLGLLLGLGGAALTARGLRQLLYQTTTFDAPSYLLVVGLLLTVALVGSYLPARRIVEVDPLETLGTS
jgi:putative ABC transport system permease protein